MPSLIITSSVAFSHVTCLFFSLHYNILLSHFYLSKQFESSFNVQVCYLTSRQNILLKLKNNPTSKGTVTISQINATLALYKRPYKRALKTQYTDISSYIHHIVLNKRQMHKGGYSNAIVLDHRSITLNRQEFRLFFR